VYPLVSLWRTRGPVNLGGDGVDGARLRMHILGMAKSTIIECPKCSAQYERTLHESPVRDQDSFECLNCGEQIERWSSSVWPSFLKIKDGSLAK